MIHLDEEIGNSDLSKGSTVSLSDFSTTSTNLSFGDTEDSHANDGVSSFDCKADVSLLYEKLYSDGYGYPAEALMNFLGTFPLYNNYNKKSKHCPFMRRTLINEFRALSATDFRSQREKWRNKNNHRRVLSRMIRDIDSWCALIYLIAGLLLMTAIFLGTFLDFHTRRNTLLAVSFSYGVCSGRGVVHMIRIKWHRLYQNEAWVRNEFRKLVLEKATKYHNHGKSCSYDEKKWHQMDMIHSFIDHIFTRYGRFESLSLSQFNKMILEETEVTLTQQELNMTFSSLDYLQDGKITPGEMYLYLKGTHITKEVTLMEVFQKVVYEAFTDRIWMATFFFLIGSSMSASNNILKRYQIDLAQYFGTISPSILISVFFVLGTLGFTYHDYHGELELYNIKEKVKRQLHYFVCIAKYNDSNTQIFNFSLETGFTKQDFRLFLDDANILMSDSIYLNIYESIKKSKSDNRIHKEEIVDFLSQTRRAKYVIFKRCLSNLMFLANFIWFIGAIGFLISACVTITTTDHTQSIWNVIGDRVSSFSYFIHDLLACLMFLKH